MAEQVQSVLDRMVPALKDLMDKGVFSETEIKAIVARRRESEYLLRRRSSRKSDYLRYIEAEKNLEKLRSLRNKKILARKAAKEREERKTSKDGKFAKPKSSSSIGDASIVQLLHLLYVRAKRKWKDDLSFHVQHAEFAKEKKSFTMLSRIYAEALQIHPRNTSLWIEAASHEYFGLITNNNNQGMSGGGSIKSARVLLQRGLRVNKDSKDLWLQSFCLELHYIQKLRGRRELLQLGLKKPKIVDTSDSDGDSGENSNGGGKNEPIESFYEEAKLPRIIYKNAIKAIPSDIIFRVKFIDQCNLFPQTQIIIDEILASIENDFGDVEDAWIARARFAINKKESSEEKGFLASSKTETDRKTNKRKLDDAESSVAVRDDPLQILNEAIDSIHTPKMYMEAIAFARSYIHHLCGKMEENGLYAKSEIGKVGNFLKNILRKAGEYDVISPGLVVESTTVLIELTSPTAALAFIEEAMKVNDECRSSSECWIKYAEVKARLSGPSSSCKILRKALRTIPMHDKGHRIILSKLFMDLIISSTSQKCCPDKELISLYDKLLLINHQKEVPEGAFSLPALCVKFMEYAASKGDISLVRKIYGKIIFSSNYPKTTNKSDGEIEDMKILFDKCIIFEKIATAAVEKSQHQRQLRRLYDAAVQFFNLNDFTGIADGFVRMKNKSVAAGK